MRNLTPLLIPFLLLGAYPGCTGPDAPGSSKEPAAPLARLDAEHTLGEPVVVENLVVWPVFTDAPLDVGEFLTLKEAVEEDLAQVREVGGGNNATVGTLVIENKGDLPILVCAGTVVQGGNQDRQIAQDLVIQAKAEVPVDAFCVEQGRWTSLRLGDATEGTFGVNLAQAIHSVRTAGQYECAQGDVWQEVGVVKARLVKRLESVADEDVAAGLENLRAHRDSSSLAVMLDANREALGEDLERRIGKVTSHFEALGDAPVGFAYAVNGEPVSVRTFAHHRVFADQFPAFVRTMCTEAGLLREEGDVPPARAEDVVALVREIDAARETVAETGALNENGVRRAEAGYGSSCYLPGKNGRVALTSDWTRR